MNYRDEIAQRKFITAISENHREGVLRVPTKLPGTVTQRSSSGDLG
jgi:hypothetical protein